MSTFFSNPENNGYRGRGSYANPHHTIAIRDIPTNIKQVQQLCRFYYCQDALLGAIIDKMAEYPITKIMLRELPGTPLDDAAKYRWRNVLDTGLNLRNCLKQIEVDKMIFGMSARYLHYPFVRYGISEYTGRAFPFATIRDLQVQPHFEKGKFTLVANGRCQEDGFRKRIRFQVVDKKALVRTGVSLTRLNPLRMEVEYAPTSDRRDWYWVPPDRLRNAMLDGVRAIIETTEMPVLEAAYQQRKLKMNPQRLWVAQADSVPGIWEGRGFPPLFRVLEDVYYHKILRRANEALAQEHVTPLRIISPAGTGDISPQRTMNLQDWQGRVRREIQKFRQDPNHILVSPLPLSIEQMGGQARVMMVAAEMEAAARIIAAGIGCPIEMIWGGLNWSGGSVSLRVLENHFLNSIENHERLIEFITPKLATYFNLPPCKVELSEFKMADDVQQTTQAVNLMTSGFLSRKSVIDELGFDSTIEFNRIAEEHERLNQITMSDNIAAAHMNNVVTALSAKAQVLLKYELQVAEEMMAARHDRRRIQDIAAFAAEVHRAGLATPIELESSAQLIGTMLPEIQQRILAAWMPSMPFVTKLIMERLQMPNGPSDTVLNAMGTAVGAQNPGAASGDVGMPTGAQSPFAASSNPGGPGMQPMGGTEPLPAQRPPRRENSPV